MKTKQQRKAEKWEEYRKIDDSAYKEYKKIRNPAFRRISKD